MLVFIIPPSQIYLRFTSNVRNSERQTILVVLAGETAHKLVQLNIGGTEVTNKGIRNLCFGDGYGQFGQYTYRCPDLIILEVSETRVTVEGKVWKITWLNIYVTGCGSQNH